MVQEFQKSVDLVKKGTPKLNVDNKTKLQFYGLYKQATVGDVNTHQPGFFEPVGKAKWNSWRSRKGMTKDEAMKHYIELVKIYY